MSEIELPTQTEKKTKTKTKTKTKDAGFADWHGNEIAASHADGAVIRSENDYNENDSDGEGLALLQTTSLNTFDESLEDGIPPSGSSSSSSSQQRARTTRAPAPASGILCKLWYKHWLGPDDPRGWTIRLCRNNDNSDAAATLLDASGLKLLKFFVVTTICLVLVHCYAAFMGDKRDGTYDLQKMIVYDGRPIVTDVVVFFVFGRLYEAEAKSPDTFSAVVPLLGTALIQSWGATHLTNLQHSITAYELKCEWTWQMYLLVAGGCLPLLGGLLMAHCREVFRKGTSLRALTEFVSSAIVFLLPYCLLSDGRFFHLHHWYYAWFLGMHCNLHGKWWSELARYVLWGIYINGVAIFGRDPVLTCSLTLYQSQSQECPYLGEGRGYGQYTLDDLANDSGVFQLLDDDGGFADDDGPSATSGIVCASDVTRWLSAWQNS
jgi:hypothetical protein